MLEPEGFTACRRCRVVRHTASAAWHHCRLLSELVHPIANRALHAQVLGGTSGQSDVGKWQLMMGNACLLLNTLSMAVYYLAVKNLVQRYPAMCVAAWAYITAATLMGLTALTLIPLGSFEVRAPA